MSVYPLLLKGVADAAFRGHVEALTRDNAHLFKANKVNPERRRNFVFGDEFDPILAAKKQALVTRLGFRDWIADPKFRDFIGCIAEGAAVHPHRDGALEGHMHVRINLLIAKPDAGGIAKLDGIAIDPEEGDGWLCFASHCEHSSTRVQGKRERRVLSYGLQVAQAEAFPLYAQFLHWKMKRAA
ncbi:MAG TPA: hypothetical protein VG387_22015 [Rhizomicrobium sp.]|nr:hypothetical protein [Rhizomicrobium sp.]